MPFQPCLKVSLCKVKTIVSNFSFKPKISIKTFCYQKERGMKNISSSQIQILYLQLLQLTFCHLGTVTTHCDIIPTEHKSLYPNKTPSTIYLSIPSRSLCSIHLTTIKNKS
jgi:hypothetical protein